jgi:hypothetical protein
MFTDIPPASGNLPSGKRGILRRFQGKAAGYSCSNGWVLAAAPQRLCLVVEEASRATGR